MGPAIVMCMCGRHSEYPVRLQAQPFLNFRDRHACHLGKKPGQQLCVFHPPVCRDDKGHASVCGQGAQNFSVSFEGSCGAAEANNAEAVLCGSAVTFIIHTVSRSRQVTTPKPVPPRAFL